MELPTSEEIKAYVSDFRNFVRGIEVAGAEATLTNTIPMPAGGVTSERSPCS